MAPQAALQPQQDRRIRTSSLVGSFELTKVVKRFEKKDHYIIMNAHIGHLNNNILSGYSYNEMEHLGTECQKT